MTGRKDELDRMARPVLLSKARLNEKEPAKIRSVEIHGSAIATRVGREPASCKSLDSLFVLSTYYGLSQAAASSLVV